MKTAAFQMQINYRLIIILIQFEIAEAEPLLHGDENSTFTKRRIFQ